jgi:hypothetical protein
VTGEPRREDGVDHPKLHEERFDPGRQRLPRTVSGEPLALDKHDAKALPRAPKCTGRPSRAASHDHDIGVRRGTLAHGSERLLSRRELMLPGAMLSQKDIRQVGVGDSLLLDPHKDATHIIRGGLHTVPLKEVETISRIALETDAC